MPRVTILRISLWSVVLAAASGCESPSQGEANQAAGAIVTEVEVVHPQRHSVRRDVGVPGELTGFETTAIHAKIAGYVRSWTANIGDRVSKGQVLAELSVPEREAELKQKQAAIEEADAEHDQAKTAVEVAQAALASAEAKLSQVRAGIKRSEAELARWQLEAARVAQLAKERAVTGSLLDETQNKLHAAESALDEVRAQVKSSEAALTEARARLDHARSDVVAAAAAVDVAREDAHRVEALLGYSKIRAPYDGIVVRRRIDTGQLTEPGATTEPLFVVARSDLVTIAVDVPESYAVDINPGDPAEIKLQAMRGRIVEGKVSRISWALEPKSRTLRVEIDLPNRDGTLRPGLYVYATIVAEEHKNALTLPTTAVVKAKEGTYCIVVAGAKAVRRPVTLGLEDGTRSEVVSGLDPRDSVVKANSASLVEGQPLKVAQPGGKP
jgi:RND family efflux transporter MFP subunit